MIKKKIVINALHTVSGGGLVYLQNLLPELAKDGRFDWHLVTTPTGVMRLGGRPALPANVQVLLAPALRFGLSHLWEQVVLPWRCRRLGAAVVWSNANYGPLLAPGAMVTVHTTPRAAAAWPGVRWKIYWSVLRVLTLLCLWRAPRAFSVARHVLPDYVPGWWPGRRKILAKVTVAPPAVGEVPKGGKVEPGLVVAVGDFYRQKQYPTLIAALAQLVKNVPAARLKIVGRPAFADVVADVQREIARWGVGEQVEMIGGLPHGELMQKLATANVFVNLSSAECFNMPVLEALALGVPVVTGDLFFQREVIGEAPETAVLVSAGGNQAEKFAVALERVLTDELLAARLRKNGQQRAAEFSWSKTAEKMLEVFAEVAGVNCD